MVEYRNIAGFPGYRVGNDGSVWSCLKSRGRGTVAVMASEWRMMRPTTSDNRGYARISLSRDGNISKCAVHRLVLEAFVGGCPDGMLSTTYVAEENGSI